MSASVDADRPRVTDETVIELLEETVSVAKRVVEGQTVRIATTTRAREHLVEEALARETVEVERVTIGRVVETAPAIREEGEFIIVPIMEEVLVVERRLVLKEEIRLKRVRTTELHRETVQLREQSATVSRVEPETLSPTQKRETP